MLCSIPTGKSSSNWLDRLRSSKGLPTGEDFPDLDHFLNHIDGAVPFPNPPGAPTINAFNSVVNSNSESTRSDDRGVTTASEISSEKQWFGIMTNVLSDLFNMGGEEEGVDDHRCSRKKKSTRKQTRPKCCVVGRPDGDGDLEGRKNSLGCARKDEDVQADATATASLNSDKYSNNGNDDEGEDVEVEEEEGNVDGGDKEELKGYSRSEVTVIDTSFEVWKCDKLVFRKKNVWKVRNKKGKSFVFGSKKRKGNDLESGHENVGGVKKKAKVLNLECGSSKDSNDDQKAQNDKRIEVSNTAPDELSEVAKKRFRCTRTPRKPEKTGTSVVLMKAVSTSKKKVMNLPKHEFKDAQKQQKA